MAKRKIILENTQAVFNYYDDPKKLKAEYSRVSYRMRQKADKLEAAGDVEAAEKLRANFPKLGQLEKPTQEQLAFGVAAGHLDWGSDNLPDPAAVKSAETLAENYGPDAPGAVDMKQFGEYMEYLRAMNQGAAPPSSDAVQRYIDMSKRGANLSQMKADMKNWVNMRAEDIQRAQSEGRTDIIYREPGFTAFSDEDIRDILF